MALQTPILAIDPGPTESAWVLLVDGKPAEFTIDPNEALLGDLLPTTPGDVTLVIEMVACYGMPVGKDVFETVFWIGRFFERWRGQRARLYRKDVKMHLCHDSRAKDGNIMQALIDRIGPKGTKAQPGPTYGCKADIWQALAVAVTAWDRIQDEAKEKKG